MPNFSGSPSYKPHVQSCARQFGTHSNYAKERRGTPADFYQFQIRVIIDQNKGAPFR